MKTMLKSNRHWPFALMLLLGLMLPSVSHAHEQHDKGESVEVLKKATVSWDGEVLPVYPQGQPWLTDKSCRQKLESNVRKALGRIRQKRHKQRSEFETQVDRDVSDVAYEKPLRGQDHDYS